MEILQSFFAPESQKPVRSPFAGGPRTIERTAVDGTKEITVIASAITPLRATLADWVSLGVLAYAAGFSAYVGFQIEDLTNSELTGLVGIPAAVFALSRWGLYRLFEKSSRVVFTPERFIRCHVFFPKRFDRAMPHSFALHAHEKKEREEELLTLREKNGKSWPFSRAAKRYYGKSYYISFEYMGQRNDLTLVYKRKKAQSIIARLKACDEIMDGYRGNGRGQTLKIGRASCRERV